MACNLKDKYMEEFGNQPIQLIVPTDAPANKLGNAPLESGSDERRKVIFSAIFAGIPVLLIWLIFGAEVFFELNASGFGLAPRKISGLMGIITSPFLHGDLNHLFSNSVPLFLLLAGTIYFYRGVGFLALCWIWLLTGIGVWLIGRDSVHIGASGIVYGLAAFLAVSGMLRNDIRLMSISLLTIFLYGGMLWGVLPLFKHISWESHLMGTLAGIYCAFRYRKQGPQQKQYFQDEEEEETEQLPDRESSEPEAATHPAFIHQHGTSHQTGGFSYTYLPEQPAKPASGEVQE
jgi:membrane associated rhomboid family serine protease